jgi:hypothetical protein
LVLCGDLDAQKGQANCTERGLRQFHTAHYIILDGAVTLRINTVKDMNDVGDDLNLIIQLLLAGVRRGNQIKAVRARYSRDRPNKASLSFRGGEHRFIQIELLKPFPGSFVPDLKDGSLFTVKEALGPQPVYSGLTDVACFSSRNGAVVVEYDVWGTLGKAGESHSRVTRIFMFEEPCLTVVQILLRAERAKYGLK